VRDILMVENIKEKIERARKMVQENRINEAVTIYHDILKILKDDESNKLLYADVAVELGTLLTNFEFYEESISLIKEAYSIYQSLNRVEDLANAAYNLAVNLLNLSRPEEALKYIEEAIKLFEKVNDSIAHADALYTYGLILSELERDEDAIKILKKAEKIYSAEGISEALISLYQDMANIYLDMENIKNAEAYLKKALKLAEELGDPSSIGDAASTAGEIFEVAGNFKKACEYYLMAAEAYKNAKLYDLALEILERVESYLNDLPKATAKRFRNKAWDLEDEIKKLKSEK